MNSFLYGALYSSLMLCALLAIEYITRKKNYPKEITRRIAHFLSGIFGAVMGLILEPQVFVTFAIVFLIIISVSYARKFFSSIHGVKRKTYGELLLPLGILSAFIISNGETTTYLVSVLILSISDPLAGLIGSSKLFGANRKAGSIAFFVSALMIIAVLFKFQQLPLLIAITLVVTIVERISNYGTDNLAIPLTTSLLLKYFL